MLVTSGAETALESWWRGWHMHHQHCTLWFRRSLQTTWLWHTVPVSISKMGQSYPLLFPITMENIQGVLKITTQDWAAEGKENVWKNLCFFLLDIKGCYTEGNLKTRQSSLLVSQTRKEKPRNRWAASSSHMGLKNIYVYLFFHELSWKWPVLSHFLPSQIQDPTQSNYYL